MPGVCIFEGETTHLPNWIHHYAPYEYTYTYALGTQRDIPSHGLIDVGIIRREANCHNQSNSSPLYNAHAHKYQKHIPLD